MTPKTFTLANTYTPYKPVKLSSTFFDSTVDREGVKDISSVSYTITGTKASGESFTREVATTAAPTDNSTSAQTNRGFETTTYLPKGSYTISQKGYTIGSETTLQGLKAFAITPSETQSQQVSTAANNHANDTSFTNTRKQMPVVVRTAWEPALEAGDDPIAQSTPGKLDYNLTYRDSTGSDVTISGKNGTANNATGADCSLATASQTNEHTGVPNYSLREEVTKCTVSDTTLAQVLPDYDTYIDAEEIEQGGTTKLVFTITASVKRANVIIDKYWVEESWEQKYRVQDENDTEIDTSDIELTYTLTRSDGGEILGTGSKSLTMKMDRYPWSGEFYAGASEDDPNVKLLVPVLRSYGADKNVKYVLTETVTKGSVPTTYYPTFEDALRSAANQFEETNPGKGTGTNKAKFRLTANGIIIDVTNAEAPYICKIEENVAGNLIETPFRRLRTAVKYADINLAGTATIQMLVDYKMPASDTVLLQKDKSITLNDDGTPKTITVTDNITLTTALTSGGIYNFEKTFTAADGRSSNDPDDMAIIRRDYTADASMFRATGGSFAIENVILDGGRTQIADGSWRGPAPKVNGGIVHAEGDASLTLRKDTTIQTDAASQRGPVLRNSKVSLQSNDAGTTQLYGLGGGIAADNTATVTMSSGRIEHCYAEGEGGGGISLFGTGTLNLGGDSVINACGVTTHPAKGGGVRVYQGTLNMTDNVRISNCSADYGAGLQADNATVNITGATGTGASGIRIMSCKTQANSGIGYGGGIYLNNCTGTTAITGQVTIIGCEARQHGGGINVGWGGKLSLGSGVIITGCSAPYGGGVNLENNVAGIEGTLNTGASITSCEASVDGGGIYVEGNDTQAGRLTLAGGTVSSCVAARNGGGIYLNTLAWEDQGIQSSKTVSLNNATVSSCTVGKDGGGIYVNTYQGSAGKPAFVVELKGTTISSCAADNNGGGLYLNSAFLGTEATLENGSKVQGCEAAGVYQATEGAETEGDGGGIYAQSYNVRISGTLQNNTAARNGGGLRIADGETDLNGDGVVASNEATNGGGIAIVTAHTAKLRGAIRGNTAAHNGGGVYASDCPAELLVTDPDAIIAGNTATGDTTSTQLMSSTGCGGGIYVAKEGSGEGRLTIEDGAIVGGSGAGNTALRGGGVYVSGGGVTLMLEACEISYNQATNGDGGGVWCGCEQALMMGSLIAHNSAADASDEALGGGIYLQESSLEMNSMDTGDDDVDTPRVQGNEADNGGGIYATNAEVAIGSCLISDNTAQDNGVTTGNGGGLYLDDSTCNFTAGSISENTAGRNGGGVFALASRTPRVNTLRMHTDANVSDNTADQGGGIYASSYAKIYLGAGTITGNTSSSDGAGIVLTSTAKLLLSGKPDFGGTDTGSGNAILGQKGNFSEGTLQTGAQNGGATYSKLRQDIYLLSEDDVAGSIVITGKLTGAEGSIWVDAASDKHYKAETQFATFDSALMTTDASGTNIVNPDKIDSTTLEAMLKVFRNARPDTESDNETDSYLYGVTGEVASQVYWNTVTGTTQIILRKVVPASDTTGSYSSLEGVSFYIYQKDGTTLAKDVDREEINKTVTDENGVTTVQPLVSGHSGVFFIGSLNYGTYKIREVRGENTYYYWLTVSEASKLDRTTEGVTFDEANKTVALQGPFTNASTAYINPVSQSAA